LHNGHNRTRRQGDLERILRGPLAHHKTESAGVER